MKSIIKFIGEFLLIGLLCVILLLAYLYSVGKFNQQAENCEWDKNMELQCKDNDE